MVGGQFSSGPRTSSMARCGGHGVVARCVVARCGVVWCGVVGLPQSQSSRRSAAATIKGLACLDFLHTTTKTQRHVQGGHARIVVLGTGVGHTQHQFSGRGQGQGFGSSRLRQQLWPTGHQPIAMPLPSSTGPPALASARLHLMGGPFTPAALATTWGIPSPATPPCPTTS